MKYAIFGFSHLHKIGDLCSRATCEHARRAPVLSGDYALADLPMRILNESTRAAYLAQKVPLGWVIPPPQPNEQAYYFVQVLD